MDVFTKYFRRLVKNSYGHIFPSGGRTAEPHSTYSGLQSEMQELSTNPEQPARIAEAIDCEEKGGDGEAFRNFDLAAFMNHFGLSPFAKTALALACRSANRTDIRTKGECSAYVLGAL